MYLWWNTCRKGSPKLHFETITETYNRRAFNFALHFPCYDTTVIMFSLSLIYLQVHEIMLIAAASAKSTEMKKIGKQSPILSTVPTRPSFPHGTIDNIASPQALCFPAKNSSICKLQGVNFLIIFQHLDQCCQIAPVAILFCSKIWGNCYCNVIHYLAWSVVK